MHIQLWQLFEINVISIGLFLERWIQQAELLRCYLKTDPAGVACAGIIADGRLLDLLRRVYCFGSCLMKMDLRQESSRHNQALDALTRCC